MSDAQAALRARLGAGARYDGDTAPQEALLLARRGAAYFARVLGGLRDTDLTAPRRRIIAATAYDARDLAEALGAFRTGTALPDPDRARRLAMGETLPARALRHLVQHADVHLNVEWRDLSDADWAGQIILPKTGAIAIADTPLRRARLVWQSALDLGGAARLRDLPAALRP